MIIQDIHSRGGTCDRCGKGLINVAVISIDNSVKNVGLDCLNKVEVSDFAVKREISFAVKDARTLGSMKRLALKGELKTKFEMAGGGPVAYYYSNSRGWQWLGLKEQNLKGLRRDIWKLAVDHDSQGMMI